MAPLLEPPLHCTPLQSPPPTIPVRPGFNGEPMDLCSSHMKYNGHPTNHPRSQADDRLKLSWSAIAAKYTLAHKMRRVRKLQIRCSGKHSPFLLLPQLLLLKTNHKVCSGFQLHCQIMLNGGTGGGRWWCFLRRRLLWNELSCSTT